MTKEHIEQARKIGAGEWIRLGIMAAVYVIAGIWQISELKTEFRVRISQLEQLVMIYQKNQEKNDARMDADEKMAIENRGRIIRLEDRTGIKN